MALDTVTDYINDVRTLLQDMTAPYRYDDTSLLVALNVALFEMRRVRPDLIVYGFPNGVPAFIANNTNPVAIEQPFRLALVFGICGHALARDQEDTEDARASIFMNDFYTMLLGLGGVGVGGGSRGGGGTPQPGASSK